MKRLMILMAVVSISCFTAEVFAYDCECDTLSVASGSELHGGTYVEGGVDIADGDLNVAGKIVTPRIEGGKGIFEGGMYVLNGIGVATGGLDVAGGIGAGGGCEFTGGVYVEGGMDIADGTLKAYYLNLNPLVSGLPPYASNGDIFVRRYYANDDHEWRDDIAAYLQGQWRRVLTTNDWHDNPIVNGNALATADVEVSTPVKIECSGQSVLSEGTAIIPFDEVFANSADETKPIIVLVTPTNAACKGIAVVKTGINEQYNGETVSGFCALELDGGKSDATFNWQAIGTAKVE